MRLAILGGGGFRTPLVYEAVAKSVTGLHVDEVVLFDHDATRLGAMRRVMTEMAGGLGDDVTRLSATTDLKEAVTDVDFVFAAVRIGGAEARTVDERVALDLGLLGQETIGPGGLAYALRTIPVMREIARAVADASPNAWVINFTNPAGIVTEAMREILGERVVGICDTPIGLVRRVARTFDVAVADVDYDYLGLNHMGWLRSARIGGVDRLPELLASDDLLAGIEEARLIGADYVRQTRALPNEYLYYYLHTDAAIRRIQEAGRTRGEFLVEQQGGFYESVADECCESPLRTWREALHTREATYMAESRDDERREEDVAGGGYQEVALRLMTAIATDSRERMILNVGNMGDDGRIVDALPDDLVLEVGCVVDGNGVHPMQVEPPTLGQLGRMARLRASERSILEAAVHRDKGAAWEGFSSHPLVDSPVLGQKLLDGYIERQPLVAALFD